VTGSLSMNLRKFMLSEPSGMLTQHTFTAGSKT